ncbi:MAG: YdcH family protein [Magnetococcales bacterium]|nr:YdcH family protein [Magnetococcales bacterium]
MFEDQLAAVQELLDSDPEFKGLHDRHGELKEKIANTPVTSINQLEVEKMKKEKLRIKDRLAKILTEFTSGR